MVWPPSVVKIALYTSGPMGDKLQVTMKVGGTSRTTTRLTSSNSNGGRSSHWGNAGSISRSRQLHPWFSNSFSSRQWRKNPSENCKWKSPFSSPSASACSCDNNSASAHCPTTSSNGPRSSLQLWGRARARAIAAWSKTFPTNAHSKHRPPMAANTTPANMRTELSGDSPSELLLKPAGNQRTVDSAQHTHHMAWQATGYYAFYQSFDARVPDKANRLLLTKGRDRLSTPKISSKIQGRLSVAVMVIGFAFVFYGSTQSKGASRQRMQYCRRAPMGRAVQPSKPKAKWRQSLSDHIQILLLCSIPGRQSAHPRCSFCTCAPGSIACLPSCLVFRQRQNQLLQKEQLGLSRRYQMHSYPKRPFVTKHHKSRQFIFLSVPNTMRTEATAGQARGLHATSQACNRTRVMASGSFLGFCFSLGSLDCFHPWSAPWTCLGLGSLWKWLRQWVENVMQSLARKNALQYKFHYRLTLGPDTIYDPISCSHAAAASFAHRRHAVRIVELCGQALWL